MIASNSSKNSKTDKENARKEEMVRDKNQFPIHFQPPMRIKSKIYRITRHPQVLLKKKHLQRPPHLHISKNILKRTREIKKLVM